MLTEKIKISKIITEKIKLSKLKINPDNPRIIRDEEYLILLNSVKTSPWMLEVNSIKIDKDFTVLAGNQRVKACRELKMKEVFVTNLGHLTKEQQQEYIIKDNKHYGEWNYSMLSEWDNEQLKEWGIEGLEEEEIKGLIEDDYIPEVKESKVKLGDIWQLGEHRIMCGDSTSSDDVEKLMNGEKADMLFTDPPYGVDYEGGHNKEKRNGIKNDKLEGNDLSNLFKNSIITSLLFTKDSSPFYIWYASGKSIETFKGLSETGIKVRAIICWYKVKSGLGAFMAQYIPNYEPCIYGHKEGKSIKWYGATDEKTVWELPNDNKNRLHPTQKPIVLGERAINNSSQVNDIVLDLFLGSGSTLIAAEKLNRKCYGMELDEKYCDVIIERWEQYTGQTAVKEEIKQLV